MIVMGLGTLHTTISNEFIKLCAQLCNYASMTLNIPYLCKINGCHHAKYEIVSIQYNILVETLKFGKAVCTR